MVLCWVPPKGAIILTTTHMILLRISGLGFWDFWALGFGLLAFRAFEIESSRHGHGDSVVMSFSGVFSAF